MAQQLGEDGRFWDGAVLPLVKMCEHLHASNRALREMLSGHIEPTEFTTRYAEAIQNEIVTGDAHRIFEPVYDALGDPKQFHEAVQVLLGIKSTLSTDGRRLR